MSISPKTLEVISTYNLDVCENDELDAFQRDTYYHPYSIAFKLWGNDSNEAAAAVRQLGEYARRKIEANKKREQGNIAQAIQHETQCDKIYNELPEFAKW